MNRMFVGIDPGKSGFIVALSESAEVIAARPMPLITGKEKDILDIVEIKRLLAEMAGASDLHVFIEKQNPMPKQGIGSTFVIGEGYGILKGICVGTHRTEIVMPTRWQKVMHAGCVGNDTKARSIEAAQRMFPIVDLRATSRSRVPHDGKADALLIAEYGRRTWK